MELLGDLGHVESISPFGGSVSVRARLVHVFAPNVP
jgi:hypothetical protein